MAALTASAPVAIRPRLVFVDGSFAELVQELADFLQISEAVEALIEDGNNEEALAQIVAASSAINAAPEKDFTGAYNLLIHVVVNESKNASAHLRTICENLLKPVTGSPVNGVSLAINALQAVFNLLEPTNPLRYNVFISIVRFLRTHGLYENLKATALPHVPSWLQAWNSTAAAQRNLYQEIASFALEQGESEEFYQFLLKALRTFDEDSVKSEEAEQLSLRAVRTALVSNTQYDFQDLRSLPTVQALADSNPIWSQLLDIFSEQDLEDYNDFQDEHEGWIKQQETAKLLDSEKLQRKIRLLTFTSLAASTQSRQIEYAHIAKALQIPAEDVEMWAIDVIRAGLVEGKLSQQQGKFLVHRTTYRVFGEKQWRELGTRVDQWRSSLTNVLTVLRRQQAEAVAHKEREAAELERKLADVGLDSGYKRRGDRNQRSNYQSRQNRPPRNDNDD